MIRPILATLGYVLSPDRERVLLIHRNKRVDDVHAGFYNGLGGKVEAGEDVASAMCREIREEAGIEVTALCLRGTISWPGFGRPGEDWFGVLFRIDGFTGQPHAGNEEGTLEWVPLTGLAEVPMWPSDSRFLPMVFDDDPRPFHGCMPFAAGQMVSWSYTR